MTSALKTVEPIKTSLLEQVVIGGDLAKLTPQERITYYRDMCNSLGLNPLTKPFAYLTLNGKLVLYAQRDCTDQLRKINGISVELTETKTVEGAYLVVAKASDKTGRSDSSTGAVWIEGLKGETRCNAMMKAETKAKRRATLSICGLGLMDDSEVDSVPAARRIDEPAPLPAHDAETGEIFPPSDNVGGDVQTSMRTTPAPEQTDESAKAESWCNEAIRRLDAATSVEAIDNWLTKNKQMLARMRAANDEAAMAVVSAADYRRRQLEPVG